MPENDDAYLITGVANVLTPALAIYPDIVQQNIQATLKSLDGDANRWRPHVKTIKLGRIMRMLVENGVTNFKCATTLELLTACRSGATDVLLAMPVVGANAARAVEIARSFPAVAVSVLIDSETQTAQWKGTGIGIFIDVNPGMNRTGISDADGQPVEKLAERVTKSGLRFRGLHYYDGQVRDTDIRERTKKAHAGYDRLLKIVHTFGNAGISVDEVITSGTPTFPCAASYKPFRSASFLHRTSPGTLIFGDLTSQSQVPASYGYGMAVAVLSRVISQPLPHQVTCDAGHKAVSVDAGVPNCAVRGWDGLIPGGPSEEHLPLSASNGTPTPKIGELLYLFPKHVCPTVNNFSESLLIRNHEVLSLEKVDARGRETPIAQP